MKNQTVQTMTVSELRQASVDSLKKLSLLKMASSPVMFIVWVGTLLSAVM